jgi:hypothetical protein
MKPHHYFEIHRADEVAECWDGVPEELYLKLWNVIVSKQKEIPNIEDNGPADVVGYENLASHWSLLSEDEQKLLNDLATKKEAEFDAWFKKGGDRK